MKPKITYPADVTAPMLQHYGGKAQRVEVQAWFDPLEKGADATIVYISVILRASGLKT